MTATLQSGIRSKGLLRSNCINLAQWLYQVADLLLNLLGCPYVQIFAHPPPATRPTPAHAIAPAAHPCSPFNRFLLISLLNGMRHPELPYGHNKTHRNNSRIAHSAHVLAASASVRTSLLRALPKRSLHALYAYCQHKTNRTHIVASSLCTYPKDAFPKELTNKPAMQGHIFFVPRNLRAIQQPLTASYKLRISHSQWLLCLKISTLLPPLSAVLHHRLVQPQPADSTRPSKAGTPALYGYHLNYILPYSTRIQPSAV